MDIDPPAELFAVTGSLSDVEREASSTHREAHGKLRLLKTLIQQGRLPRRAVLIIRGDNKAAVNLLCGRRSEIWELTRVHREIFQILKDYELETYAEWIPRDKNQLADALGKILDPGDIRLNPVWFRTLSFHFAQLGYGLLVDRFANVANAQLARWCGRFAGLQLDGLHWSITDSLQEPWRLPALPDDSALSPDLHRIR